MFCGTDQRQRVAKAVKVDGGKEIWELILKAIDAGFLTPNSYLYDIPNLRLLFSAVKPKKKPNTFFTRYILTNPDDRAKVCEYIMPAALANQDAVLADPEQLEGIVNTYIRQMKTTQKLEAALKMMPAHEQEIIMFGERLWPRLDNEMCFDYDQVQAAIWYFRDQDRFQQAPLDENPASRAINIRNSTRWLKEYVRRTDDPMKINRVLDLVSDMALLLNKNPHGECKAPATPKIERPW